MSPESGALKPKKFNIANGVSLNLFEDSSGHQITGYQPVEILQVTLDAAAASEILQNHNIFKKQRKLNEPRVKEYVRRMQNGLWHRTQVTLVRFVNNAGKAIMSDGKQRCLLFDGQHTLHSIAECNIPQPITILIYEMTPKNAEKFFSQIDDIKNRTSSDILGPLCGTFGQKTVTRRGREEQMDIVSASMLTKITRGIWFALNGRGGSKAKKLYKDMQVDIIREESRFINWLINSLNHKPDAPFRESHIWTQSAIASMYITWCHGDNETQATEFWRRVTMNCDHAPGNPTHTLNAFMSFEANAQNAKRNKNLSILAVCADCWNSFVKFGVDCETDYDWNDVIKKDKIEPAYFDGHTIDESLDHDAIGLEIAVNSGDEVKEGHTDHRKTLQGGKKTAARKSLSAPPKKKSNHKSIKPASRTGANPQP